MSFLTDLFGGGGGSSSSTSNAANVTADNRLATAEVSGQVAAPYSVVANPMSQGISASGQADVTQTFQAPINLGLDSAGVNSLVGILATTEAATVNSLADLQKRSSADMTATVSGLTDVLSAAKGDGSTATRYLPWLAVGAVVVLAYLMWRRK